MYDILQRPRLVLHEERHVLVQLVKGPQQCIVEVFGRHSGEISPHAVHITVGMTLHINPKVVVGIAEQHLVFLGVEQHGYGKAVQVVTLLTVNILVWPSGVHGVYGSHKSRMLVDRIAVHHNIFQHHCHLAVATRLKPVEQSSAVEISPCYAFVVEKHRDKLLHVLCHEVALWINHE